MGRELKRVALDLDWPLREVWKGFINPHYAAKNCATCEGSGYTPEAKLIVGQWYGHVPFSPEEYGVPEMQMDEQFIEIIRRKIDWSIELDQRDGKSRESNYYIQVSGGDLERAVSAEASRMYRMQRAQWCYHLNQDDVDVLVAGDRLWDFTKRGDNPHHPTAEEVNLWSLQGMSHDAINRMICVRARCEREGIETSCETCQGAGDIWLSEEAREIYEAWEDCEPPEGIGYQVWETVSEGSPVSPVFAKPEALASWMVDNDDSVTRDTGYDGWMKFITVDQWAPSMISSPSTGPQSGVKALTDD